METLQEILGKGSEQCGGLSLCLVNAVARGGKLHKIPAPCRLYKWNQKTQQRKGTRDLLRQ